MSTVEKYAGELEVAREGPETVIRRATPVPYNPSIEAQYSWHVYFTHAVYVTQQALDVTYSVAALILLIFTAIELIRGLPMDSLLNGAGALVTGSTAGFLLTRLKEARNRYVAARPV